jgi:hypothetical protein
MRADNLLPDASLPGQAAIAHPFYGNAEHLDGALRRSKAGVASLLDGILGAD